MKKDTVVQLSELLVKLMLVSCLHIAWFYAELCVLYIPFDSCGILLAIVINCPGIITTLFAVFVNIFATIIYKCIPLEVKYCKVIYWLFDLVFTLLLFIFGVHVEIGFMIGYF